MLRSRVLPMNKKDWAAKFKKYAVLAGVNEPKKSCHGVQSAGLRSPLTPTAPRAR
jgi:hypothetical protein